MKKRAHIHMHGDVVGVGFRFLVKQKAQSLALKGFCAQNEEKVMTIEVEGDLNRLEEFLEFIQKGVSPFTQRNAFEIQLFDNLKGYTTMESDIV